MQRNQFIKAGILVISLFMLGACSSTSETEEPMEEANASTTPARPAAPSAAPSSGQLTQEQIRAQNALRQTVFYFDFDVAEFKPADRDTLTFHARDLAANPGKRIRLEGHADERGTREYNLALGERRANGILNYFIVNGASRAQIETVSYGEERPAQQGQTEQAYSRNRRVEVVAR
ncbi:MAG: peptidoglycan-associated lipoprotein Pal [Proteobacteria bacterium]|nr:peptidoglycan-associated lipoprotein Pal [Pseudomonadota bacterium]